MPEELSVDPNALRTTSSTLSSLASDISFKPANTETEGWPTKTAVDAVNSGAAAAVGETQQKLDATAQKIGRDANKYEDVEHRSKKKLSGFKDSPSKGKKDTTEGEGLLGSGNNQASGVGGQRVADMDPAANGLDYAGGRIPAADLKANGIDFVSRYLTPGGDSLPGKQLTPEEFTDLSNNGIAVVFNWETGADAMRGGATQGAADAQAALNYVRSLPGAPQNPVIYFSADFDSTPQDQVAINDYLRSAGQVIGPQNVGIYGGYWSVSRALDAGVANWAWQTEAWSGGQVDPRVNMIQHNSEGYRYIDGVQADIDTAQTPNYGQFPPPTPAVSPVAAR